MGIQLVSIELAISYCMKGKFNNLNPKMVTLSKQHSFISVFLSLTNNFSFYILCFYYTDHNYPINHNNNFNADNRIVIKVTLACDDF